MSNNIYMSVVTQDGEMLTEDACSKESIGGFYKEDHDEESLILGYKQLVDIPTDERSGEITGSVTHHYLKVKKFIDKASPLLINSFITNDDLEVELSFYRNSTESGTSEHFYTISLEEASIVEVKLVSPDITEYEEIIPYEEITFAYKKIEWNHEVASTTALHDVTGG